MLGCRLPSPAWKTLHTRTPCFAAIVAMLAEHLRQPRARHDRVLHEQVRRDAAHRAERLLAALPELAARSASSRATRTLARLRPRQIAATRSRVAIEAGGEPSSSISSTAAASRG